LVVFIANIVIMAILSFIPVAGQILGLIICFFVDALIVKGIFKTSYGKGLLTVLLYFIIIIIVAVIVGAIVGFGTFAALGGY